MKWFRNLLLAISAGCMANASISAQVTCTGSFGENIFVNGDFGSGQANIPSIDPGIAPGYTYTTQTPPSDGYYTLTNNISRWSNNYSSWINIGDNSDDPLGYMMVVNASYSPGKFYEQTIPDLCPNTIYEFSADVINIVRKFTPNHSLPDLEFLINDSVMYSTGKIPQDEKWYKHGFTFSLEPDQTEIKVTLVNKAPGGSGNDLALDNITFRPCGPEEVADLERYLYFCKDDSVPVAIAADVDTARYAIQWQKTETPGINWVNAGPINTTMIEQELDTPGTFYYRYLSGTTPENLHNPNCRSNSVVITAEVLPLEYEIWDTICEQKSRIFNGQTYSSTGSYIASMVSSRGCDSTVTLHLEVVNKSPLEVDTIVTHPLCFNATDGRLEVLNARGGYPPYKFALDSEINTSGVFEGLGPGNKIIEVTDKYGCLYKLEADLVNPPLFELYMIKDTQLILGESLTIHVEANQPIISLSSTPAIYSDCMDCNPGTFLPVESDIYQLEAENYSGCLSTVEFLVTVNDEDLPIVFPNAFSPNNDGVNDAFRIISPPQLIQRMVSVKFLDRWGNIQYDKVEDSNIDQGVLWDGHNGRSFVEPGVYAYICQFELINGVVKVFSGEVTVVR